MFILTTLKDNVRVEPEDLGRPTAEAVSACLESTFINKVIADVGLVVKLYDLLEVTGGHIYPSDGAAHYEATFRVLVFRPFQGEVLVGRITHAHPQGLQVSLGFFDDVHVAPDFLPEPSMFEPGDKGAGEWFWQYDDNRMYLERNEPVTFEPVPTGEQLRAPNADGAPRGSAANPFAPMTVNASIAEEGLGLAMWWEQPADGADDMEDA